MLNAVEEFGGYESPDMASVVLIEADLDDYLRRILIDEKPADIELFFRHLLRSHGSGKDLESEQDVQCYIGQIKTYMDDSYGPEGIREMSEELRRDFRHAETCHYDFEKVGYDNVQRNSISWTGKKMRALFLSKPEPVLN